MDYKSEPSLVPEWLNNSGSGIATGGRNTSASYSSLPDDQGVFKPARNKSSDSLRSPGSDRITSSYLRRNNSSSNGSAHARSYSSFSRNQRDMDWDFNKEIYREKSIFSDYRPDRDNSDPFGNILRCSQSSISRKVPVADSINRNGNTVIRGTKAVSFKREFPSLGTEADTEIKRVPSPVLSTIQNLPIGSSAVIGGNGWTSALAEVPVIVASKGYSGSASPPSSASSPITGSTLNMAETVAQGPSRVQITPQLSVGTQRLEELALKQSRQLIPVITSVPKALVLNTSDKSKPKVGGPQQHQSPRGGPTKSDLSKTSAIGKLQVLKPARERNGVSPVPKDNNNNNSSSPTNISKSPNSPLAVGNNPLHVSADRKPALSEKRPTPNAQSRHDFFNLVRKKSMTNSSSATPDPNPAVSATVLDKLGETEATAIPPRDRDIPLLNRSSGAHSNGKILIPYTEEEEVSLLRSMGWDENSGEEEGLTEEEINAFRNKYANSKSSAKVFPRMGSAEV